MDGRIVLEIPDWHPTILNRLLGSRQRSARLKADDAQMVAGYALAQGVAKATSRRRVSLELSGWPRGRKPDPDAFWKSLLDALVKCGLLKDDAGRWCELGTVTLERSARRVTRIVLEDVPDEEATSRAGSGRHGG